MKKKIFIVLGILFFVILTAFCTYLFVGIQKFSVDKIMYTRTQVLMYDNKNTKIYDYDNSSNFVSITSLNDYTIDAFLSIEDKEFFNHNGLNYKRIAGAILENIKQLSYKQGASTISQQLIKNTHLSNEKTLKRKFNEILLTKQMERKLTKNQILQYYLNIIYFGDNCYGIQNAAKHYFSINAKELNLQQSATLAAMIKSPNYYSPESEFAHNRRNLVLDEMYKDGKINIDEYLKAKKSKIITKYTEIHKNYLGSYQNQVINEACSILKMPQKQIAINGYKIHTFFDSQKQKNLEAAINNENISTDYSAISLNSKTNAIEAYISKCNVNMFAKKRQVGSVIKPTLVYAPALNENIISPLTQLNDEKIDINGYSPKNANNSFDGYISVRQSLANSTNTTAVKTLSYTGIQKSKAYAQKAGLDFDNTDSNLALALGGMKNGLTLSQITASYGTFTNNGNFIAPKFINYITDTNGQIVYLNKKEQKKVFRDDTAYLVTDMLKSCAKTGTGRALSTCNFPVATKTGTVGNKYNTDAYNISYTTKDIVGVWLGNADMTKIEEVGGGKPTRIAKSYLSNCYKNKIVADFVMPSSVYKEKIDSLTLNEKHSIYKANDYIAEKYIIEELFSRFNPPKYQSTNYLTINPPKLSGKVYQNTATLSFNANDYLQYDLYKIENGKQTLIKTFINQNDEISFKHTINKQTSFFIITKIKNYASGKEIISDKSNVVKLVPIKNNKWYL